MGQRHNRVQTETEQRIATVDSCFDLVGSRLHSAACKLEVQHEAGWPIVYLMYMVMTSDETQIQMFADYWSRTKQYEQYAGRFRDKETADRQKLSRRKPIGKP